MRKAFRQIIFVFLRIASDALIVAGSFIFSFWVRFYSGLFSAEKGIPSFEGYLHVLPILCVAVLFFMRSYGLYSERKLGAAIEEFIKVFKSTTFAMLVLMAATFMYREFSYSRGLIVIAWISNTVFLGAWRNTFSSVQSVQNRKKQMAKRLLLVGAGETGKKIYDLVKKDPRTGYKFAGFISTEQKEDGDIHVVGAIENLPDVLSKYHVDEVILTKPGLAHQKIVDVILECEKRMISFKMVPDLLGMVTSQVDVQTLGGITILGLKESPLNLAYNRFLKRSMDILCSATGLILLSPMLLVMEILIKKDSKGPVFYRQERIGEDGKKFMIYKFRTMQVDAEKETGPVWAKENDTRRTKFGAFLRKYNIDELPQLINVFKGDMSLVGPRPERPVFVSKFKEDIPRYMSRHKIKSGMTGWAQVNGLRGDTSIEERTKYDLYYIENWSLLLDFRIILMSFAATKNAY